VRASLDGPAPEIERLRARIAASSHPEYMVQSTVVLADLLWQAGRGREALGLLQSRQPPPPEYLALEAEIAADGKDLERATALWSAALAARPSALGTRRELAEAYSEMRRTSDALAQYGQLIEAQPWDAGLRVDRGVVLLRAGRLSEAEADFREATRLDEMLPEAFLNLGLVELQSGREADAETHLTRAIELRPDYAKAHFHLARLYRRRNDPRAASEARLAAMGDAAGQPTGSPLPSEEAPRPQP
jgi:tetratricopeptide (TPR) repeat protein